MTDTDTTHGLNPTEVAQRRADGRSNDVPNPTSRTIEQIVRANVFTPFNLLLGILLVVIIAVGEYRDSLFGIVLVLNTLIGIVQEVRSKQALDRLAVLNAPTACVVRDGTEHELGRERAGGRRRGRAAPRGPDQRGRQRGRRRSASRSTSRC